MEMYIAAVVVMGATMGQFFKPEKNFSVNNLVDFWGNSGWAYDCDSFLGYWGIT